MQHIINIILQLNVLILSSSVCVAVPEQRMHSVLCLQRHRQTDPAEPQEPRGKVQNIPTPRSISFIFWGKFSNGNVPFYSFVLFHSAMSKIYGEIWRYMLRTYITSIWQYEYSYSGLLIMSSASVSAHKYWCVKAGAPLISDMSIFTGGR